jgi:hypothetical protein
VLFVQTAKFSYVKRLNDKMKLKHTFICSSEVIIGNRLFSHTAVERPNKVGDGH